MTRPKHRIVDCSTGAVTDVEMTDEELATLLPPPTIADLRAYAAARRYAVETGGIVVGGRTIDTSRESQALIASAHAYVLAQPETEIQFKAASGWVTLSAAEVTTIALAVAAHVQACFAAERAVAAGIDAGTITTTAQIDAALAA